MTVSEIERTELVSHLVTAIGKGPTETLMKCIIVEGHEELATKNDLRVLASGLRGEISGLRGELRGEISGLRSEMDGLRSEMDGLRSEVRGEISALRGYIDSALAKQARVYLTTMIGFMVTIWGTMLVQSVV